MANLVLRNANEAIVAPIMWFDGLCDWRKSGVWRGQVGSLFSSFFRSVGWNLVIVAVNMFSHIIYLIYYEFCTFNAICKNNDAIICMVAEH